MSGLRAAFGRRGIASWTIGLVLASTVGPGSALVVWLAVLGVPVDRMGVPLQRVFICSLPLAALFLWTRRAVGSDRAFALRFAISTFVWLEFLLLLLPPAARRLGLLSPADLAIQNTLAVTAIFAALSLLTYRRALQIAKKWRPPAGAAPRP